MFKQIRNKFPRKSSKASDQGGSGSGNGNNVVNSKPGNSNSSALHNNQYNNGRGEIVNPNRDFAYLYEETLPAFKDVPNSEKQSLFVNKLKLCSVVFDFTDGFKNLKEKEIKRKTLSELVDHITSAYARFSEFAMQEVVKMVSINIFRTLRPHPRDNKFVDGLDMDDEESSVDPSWPHLQIVYEFFLRFIASPEVEAKVAKRYINQSFILKLLNLFDSEDHREREYLKITLHRVYGKFMVHRPFIRKSINNVFFSLIFETDRHNGIAELLEILGSIINGFALPLKEEHKLFLVRALIPLHKPKCLAMYHQQLSYCITQFVEKDCKLADTIIRGLLKYWPITNSSKEVMFLGELEEVLEATQPLEFQRCMVLLFHRIARCLNSPHFQVAERALFLWNNDRIQNLINQNRKVILPIVLPALERNTRRHWNQAVCSLTLNVRKIFYNLDTNFYNKCLQEFEEYESKKDKVIARRESTWKQLEEVAAQKAGKSATLFIK